MDIRTISKHQTEHIARGHEHAYETLQAAAVAEADPQGPHHRALARLGIDSPSQPIVVKHERFRRLKWAVGVPA